MRSWQKFVIAAIPALVIILGLGLKLFDFSPGAPALETITPVQLEGHHRLLILAPHCDDETLGSAGLILVAQRIGIDVKVVIATNGDGYLFATMEDFHRIYPHASDFVRMGETRQSESLAAMRVLGVSPDQVIFLGYPDRGTPMLWNEFWSASNPYTSPFIKASRSPYQNTYNPKSVYAGEDYLADLRSILVEYRPDMIVYPHPDDIHPDHWGLSVFTRLAVALEEQDSPDYHPDLYAYLIHRPDFPVHKGLEPQNDLLPPPLLVDIYPEWYRLDLSSTDISLKAQAVAQYKTQLPLLRNLLESFIRANELFTNPQPARLETITTGDVRFPETWLNASGQAIQPVQKDPAKDFFTRDVLPSADLLAVYVAKTQNGQLRVCAQVRAATRPAFTYTLQLKIIGSNTTIQHIATNDDLRPGQHRLEVAGKYFCDSIDPADLGDPWLLLVAAEVKEPFTGILDQTAWQVVKVHP